MPRETLIIGAGIAGLSCALSLRRGGAEVKVLERSHGVGGRCATRRFAGQPVDHGVAFLHGSDGAFVAAMRAIGEGLIGWPLRVVGRGTPCQPQAFSPGEFRMAFAEGVTLFPKRLAEGLPVEREARVIGLRMANDQIEVAVEGQTPRRAGCVVLALALEQSLQLLRTLPAGMSTELDGAQALLGMEESVPCLSIMARYDPAHPGPSWDVCYPEDSSVLGLISHESAKRPVAGDRVLVFQALPRYSRAQLASPVEVWVAEMLSEAGRLLGAWAAQPCEYESHRWLNARVEQSARLAAPMLLPLPGGPTLGICGDAFSPSGGVEAAFLSGRRLAARILEEE